MHRFLLVFLLCASLLSAENEDFDVVVIGSSPFCLLEALYRYHLGNRVLILEQDEICGGAWRSIDACGISHVDLGCHQIGHDAQLLHFLEDYVGCKMVSLDNPSTPFMNVNTNGYYFSKGCYELMSHLLNLIEKTGIVLLLNHRLESVKIDPVQPIATLKTKGLEITASKVIIPLYAEVFFEDYPFNRTGPSKSKFPHLYALIEDPSPPRFTYKTSIGPGISRMMNLTYFVGMEGSGRQLIVFQSYGSLTFETAEGYLELLKEKEMVHPSAKLLAIDSYVYQQTHYSRSQVNQVPNAASVVETLSTGHIQNLSQYVAKWKMVLKPYYEAMAM